MTSVPGWQSWSASSQPVHISPGVHAHGSEDACALGQILMPCHAQAWTWTRLPTCVGAGSAARSHPGSYQAVIVPA